MVAGCWWLVVGASWCFAVSDGWFLDASGGLIFFFRPGVRREATTMPRGGLRAAPRRQLQNTAWMGNAGVLVGIGGGLRLCFWRFAGRGFFARVVTVDLSVS